MGFSSKNTEKRFKKTWFLHHFCCTPVLDVSIGWLSNLFTWKMVFFSTPNNPFLKWMFRVAWLHDRRRGRGTRGRGLTADDDLFGWGPRIDVSRDVECEWEKYYGCLMFRIGWMSSFFDGFWIFQLQISNNISKKSQPENPFAFLDFTKPHHWTSTQTHHNCSIWKRPGRKEPENLRAKTAGVVTSLVDKGGRWITNPKHCTFFVGETFSKSPKQNLHCLIPKQNV